MSELKVVESLLSSLAVSVAGAATVLGADPCLSGSVEGVLQSASVAEALQTGTAQQQTRCSVIAVVATEAGGFPRTVAAELASADARLARLAF
ncbi:hypothetical protein D6T64_21550 [Cryobacterium melibiosiphilum]|uniref:Uncharacterized protein n=1 Tax=Cryobacterium melibiosiphilum TaxID=995039 RepID=A0A3A5MA70_9MICO|nr:hypothetical protein [Cryobacterium melibiosiphilum]RJT84733.1 hypothetical protein D6T64_21550 [Cryobacterium melibiosiphilum]